MNYHRMKNPIFIVKFPQEKIIMERQEMAHSISLEELLCIRQLYFQMCNLNPHLKMVCSENPQNFKFLKAKSVRDSTKVCQLDRNGEQNETESSTSTENYIFIIIRSPPGDIIKLVC